MERKGGLGVSGSSRIDVNTCLRLASLPRVSLLRRVSLLHRIRHKVRLVWDEQSQNGGEVLCSKSKHMCKYEIWDVSFIVAVPHLKYFQLRRFVPHI